ncbi:SLC13 family permease [Rhodococcus aetherivorans]|uniref:SLC13 family permease n=1 Tax=Rhodococcus aetherivorans TaxID=191292 RepID=UPI00163A2BCC|nr:SLC13 family permease [Rhodococcus aetherivorans]MBC2586894.1 C4-dicarboxylate ABC transporter [Rhodococcus aetherivorans]
MALQIAALGICVAVFALAAYRSVHVGILMLVAASAVGVGLADMPVKEVLGGFPIDLVVLLAGVTFFFGVAQANGTVDKLIDSALRRLGERTSALPLAFFGMTTAIGSMGNPGAALVMVPIGMNIAKKKNLDPMLMALAMGTGISAGGFAPTSLFGIVTYGTAREAGISLSPMLLFVVALVFNLLLLAVAYLIFGRSRARHSLPSQLTVQHAHELEFATVGTSGGDGADSEVTGSGGAGTGGTGGTAPEHLRRDDGRPVGFSILQKITVASMAALVGTVVITAALGANPNVGLIAFAFGAVLALLDPKSCNIGISKIDWSTILLVGGIITYVGVLEHLGAVDLLGDFAASMSVPLIAAFVVCVIAGLVSAFASTTGMLAALVPLAIPLVAAGGIPGWAMICAIGVCASIVDVSPFSTVGATMVATTPDESERPRVTRLLMRWGLSMVVIGPVAMVIGLIVPSMIM